MAGNLIYGRQSWELWKGYICNKHLNILFILFIIIYCTSSPQNISSLFIHIIVNFLLLNTAKCRALLQVFHEIQPYGFDINGKCDCRPSELSSPSLPRFFFFKNMHDNGEPFTKSPHPGQLFQLRISNPSLAVDSRLRMSPVSRTSGVCQAANYARNWSPTRDSNNSDLLYNRDARVMSNSAERVYRWEPRV